MRTCLISAICTPLGEDDSLDVDALAAHLDDQWRHGIGGGVDRRLDGPDAVAQRGRLP